MPSDWTVATDSIRTVWIERSRLEPALRVDGPAINQRASAAIVGCRLAA